MNFEQILRQKMQEKTPTQTTSADHSSSFHVGADPAHLAYLIGQIRRTNTPSTPAKYPYKPVILERKAHAFNKLQECAYHFFLSLVPDLKNSFTQRELKKAFRRAALMVHPDRGGNAESFLQLKSHYECLQALVV